MILITGADGFIGNNLCKYLDELGYEVKKLIRKKPNQSGKICHNTYFLEDLEYPTKSKNIFSGVKAVIHLAASAHKDQTKSTTANLNFNLANKIITECRKNKIKKFIFLSSIGVLGDANKDGFNEFSLPNPNNAYTKSKWLIEQLTQKTCEDSCMSFVIIRAPLVYGNGAIGSFLQLLKIVSTGLPLPFLNINSKKSFININNLCDLIEVCLSSENANNQTLLVSDDSDVKVTDLVRLIQSAFGLRQRLFFVPPSLLLFVGKLVNREDSVKRFTCNLTVDISYTKSLLNWKPKYPINEAIEQSVSGFKEAKRKKI